MSYVLAHWSPAWVVLAVWAVLAAAHLAGQIARGREGRGRTAAWRAAAFQGGLLTVLLALVSPLAYWSLTFIWVRSMQDLLLAVVAPALIATGAPGRPRFPDIARGVWWRSWPVATTLAFNAVWLGWHLPAPYDLAATNPVVRYAQFLSYLGAGLLFWLPLIGPGAVTAPMRRLALLVATAAADTILGMVLVFGAGVVYPAYRGAAHHLLSVVADQQVGGAVLWMGMLPPLIIVAVALLLGWLAHEESDELSRELDRLAGAGHPPASRPVWATSGRVPWGRTAWPARPGHRRPTV